MILRHDDNLGLSCALAVGLAVIVWQVLRFMKWMLTDGRY